MEGEERVTLRFSRVSTTSLLTSPKGGLRGCSYSLVYLGVSVYRAYGLAYHRDLSFSRGKGINIFLHPCGLVFAISYSILHEVI
jgi:hypothetical protein